MGKYDLIWKYTQSNNKYIKIFITYISSLVASRIRWQGALSAPVVTYMREYAAASHEMQ